jgi:fermentation-respiration switch protein FrsA (DUF1100 family)
MRGIRLVSLIWVVTAIAVIVAAVALLVRSYEASLAFFPTRGEDATPGAYGVPYTPLTATTSDGERVRVWHLTHEAARARVVYFHGNGGNLSMWADVLVGLPRHGFEVVAFDYRGYGVSTGSPSEQGLYRDVEAVLSLVHDRLRRTDVPLIYWGRSLGATMAAYAATLREPNGVVLEAGFPSTRAVTRANPILWALSWFSTYEFPTIRFMTRTRAPALILHGDRDSVIPFALGQELYEAIPGPKQFFVIKGGDHNDPVPADVDSYWRAIDEFVSRTR